MDTILFDGTKGTTRRSEQGIIAKSWECKFWPGSDSDELASTVGSSVSRSSYASSHTFRISNLFLESSWVSSTRVFYLFSLVLVFELLGAVCFKGKEEGLWSRVWHWMQGSDCGWIRLDQEVRWEATGGPKSVQMSWSWPERSAGQQAYGRMGFFLGRDSDLMAEKHPHPQLGFMRVAGES